MNGFGDPSTTKQPFRRLVKPPYSASEWITREAETSAIPLDLMMANVQWVEAEEAVEILAEQALSKAQRVHSYLTQAGKRVLIRYEFARSGGWVAYGTTVDGSSGLVPYFKPVAPRTDFCKKKTVKYETPAGLPATPILPYIDGQTAQKIFERFNVEPLLRETFWQTVWRCNLPIVITEGLKKALSLIAYGIPAIALRGVTCWHKKGSAELHDAIAHFATPGRKLYICFDQDTKASTIRNVHWEICKLGRALEGQGCNVAVMGWSPELGKGVDDVLFAQGEDAQSWLDDAIAISPTFEEWGKGKRKEHLLRVWRYLESLGIEPDRLTVGPYLPPLPELECGAIQVIDSPTGTGKTTQLKFWVKAGYFVLVLSPLNSLGKQTAESWELPHRHDCGTDRDQQEAFRFLVYDANGVVACIDSLQRLQEFISDDTPLVIILDECNQVLESLNIGGTLGSRQAEILELFAKCLKIAACNGAIVLSEANVNRRTLKQIQELSGCDKVRYFKHEADRQPWHCDIATGDSSGFVAELLSPIGEGKRIMLTVSSQTMGEKIERYISEVFKGEKQVLRIDSETNQNGAFNAFWINPNNYLSSLLQLPDVLILSPSAKSGVSITVPGFDEVWGLFTCHYPGMWAQQLGRYRLPVPRKIFVPRFIPASSSDEGYCSIKRVQQQLQADLNGYQRVFGLAEAIDDEAEPIKIQQSQQNFYSEHQTSIGIQKQFPIECLTEILEGQGHIVTHSTVHTHKEIKASLKCIQQQLWQEDAELFAAARPLADTKETYEVLNSIDLTTEKRFSALKTLYRDEFPGVDFDDVATCYAALTENFGKLRRGVLLQARAANLETFKAIETESVEGILNGKIKLAHRLPKSFFKAALIKQIGLLSLLDGSPYQELDDRIQAIKTAALHYAGEIYKYFVINVKADQTGIEIANKLLKKLGLKAEVLRKVGGRGHQVKIWGISDLCNPIRVRLLQAATQKLGGDAEAIVTHPPESYYRAMDREDPPVPSEEITDFELADLETEQQQDFAETIAGEWSLEVGTA